MTDPNRDDPLEERDGADEHEPDNDEERHVPPTDNDGETVPRDEVVDQVGG